MFAPNDEGNRWIEDAEEVNSVEQVRRRQVMLAQLIGEQDSKEQAA